MNMFVTWIEAHPWMTFILGMMSLATLNTFFISVGGGYKKFPPVTPPQTPRQSVEKEIENLLKD